MLTPPLIQAIDHARQHGRTYDEVVQVARQHGVPEHHILKTLQAYRRVPLPDGRKRGEVNLGEPTP